MRITTLVRGGVSRRLLLHDGGHEAGVEAGEHWRGHTAHVGPGGEREPRPAARSVQVRQLRGEAADVAQHQARVPAAALLGHLAANAAVHRVEQIALPPGQTAAGDEVSEEHAVQEPRQEPVRLLSRRGATETEECGFVEGDDWFGVDTDHGQATSVSLRT